MTTPPPKSLLPELRAILEDDTLDTGGKLDALRKLETDARDRSVAASEGMSGDDARHARLLREVHTAREWIEANA